MIALGNLFSLSNVSVVRDGNRILGPLDLSIDEGESIAVIGRNGSGKTTLSMLLKKEIAPYHDELAQSSLKILGKKDWDIFDLRKIVVSVSTDDERYFDRYRSVGEVILSGMFGSDAIYPIHEVTRDMVSRMSELMTAVGLTVAPEREFGTLSQGERRCAMIARALMPQPEVMILDEPTNSLDPIASASFITMIDGLIGKGISVIMVTHRLEDIPKSIGRVIGIRGGQKVADGKKEDVLTDASVSEIYGADVKVTSDGGIYTLSVVPQNL